MMCKIHKKPFYRRGRRENLKEKYTLNIKEDA